MKYIIVCLAFSSFIYTACYAYYHPNPNHFPPNREVYLRQRPSEKKSNITLVYCIMKSVKYIVNYLIFTGIIYLLIYVFLYECYSKNGNSSINLVMSGEWRTQIQLKQTIKKLENKMPLFYFYWPVAAKDFYLFIRTLEIRQD